MIAQSAMIRSTVVGRSPNVLQPSPYFGAFGPIISIICSTNKKKCIGKGKVGYFPTHMLPYYIRQFLSEASIKGFHGPGGPPVADYQYDL